MMRMNVPSVSANISTNSPLNLPVSVATKYPDPANCIHRSLDPSRLRRVAIFRALRLGDTLCAIPAFRALRRTCPEAEIHWIGLPWAASFARRFEMYVDRFIEFPGFPALPERVPDLARIPAFLEEMQRMEYDLVLQWQGSGELSNPLITTFGAQQMAGFYRPGSFCPDSSLFFPFSDREHEVLRLLNLLNALGFVASDTDLEFPLQSEDGELLRRFGIEADLAGRPYICIHPGARSRWKCWPTNHFARVADVLAERGFRIVLTGSAVEMDLTLAVRSQMRYPALDVACLDLPLGTFARLLSGASLLISNDTGVSHLAAALRVPSAVVFSVTDPHRWAPLDRERHRVLSNENGVEVVEVVDEALALLNGSRGGS